MSDNDRFEYDVALSFAGEDRGLVEELGDMLRARDMKVLYDQSKAPEPGNKDFVLHLAEIFRTKAWYCVLFISQHYPIKTWTKEARLAAQDHALRDASQYILPLQLGDMEVPGMMETPGYIDPRQQSVEEIANVLEQKVKEAKSRSAPPSKSHDLRSGNVRST